MLTISSVSRCRNRNGQINEFFNRHRCKILRADWSFRIFNRIMRNGEWWKRDRKAHFTWWKGIFVEIVVLVNHIYESSHKRIDSPQTSYGAIRNDTLNRKNYYDILFLQLRSTGRQSERDVGNNKQWADVDANNGWRENESRSRSF